MLETEDINLMRDQFNAWMLGATARASGRPLAVNPYPSRSAKADAWENGWAQIDYSLKGSEDGQ